MTLPIGVADRSWRWHLERACAVVLIVLLPLHVVLAMIVGDPAAWSTARLAVRWQVPLWRMVDWLTLSVALVHGLGAARRRCPAGGLGAAGRVALDVVLAGGLVIAAAAALTWRVA